ncbi:MAG: HAD family phosphatase [Chloroflexi bacterium]|nr:HAD family phosphatase [Chloroflexota bacterium]
MSPSNKPIRLILFDIDGTLTDGEATPLDLDLMARLAEMNRASRADPERPAVTLCTGRQPSYAEAMLQAIDGHVPAIYENGCGLYVPHPYAFVPHPLVEQSTTFEPAKKLLEDALVPSGRAFFQAGKDHSLSIYAHNGDDTQRLYEWSCQALGDLRDEVSIAYAASCLNVMPRGIDKGTGLDMLCEKTGYRPGEILAVGDSDNDLEFLAKAGVSAAPANANVRIKALVDYVSPYETSLGIRDILRYFEVVRL